MCRAVQSHLSVVCIFTFYLMSLSIVSVSPASAASKTRRCLPMSFPNREPRRRFFVRFCAFALRECSTTTPSSPDRSLSSRFSYSSPVSVLVVERSVSNSEPVSKSGMSASSIVPSDLARMMSSIMKARFSLSTWASIPASSSSFRNCCHASFVLIVSTLPSLRMEFSW